MRRCVGLPVARPSVSFSLHAATTVAGDAAGREALCRCMLRPPLSQDRTQLVAGDLVRLVPAGEIRAQLLPPCL